MIYLYIKTHNQTGLRYLGQTKAKDPHKYPGSGKYWKQHLKKHGLDFSTEILRECSTQKEVKHWGEYYSKLWNVVNDPTWANLKPETGDGGWPKNARTGKLHSAESKQKISLAKKGVPNPKNAVPRTDEQKEHLRNINSGKTIPQAVIDKIAKTKLEHPYRHSEEFKERMRVPKTPKTRLRMKEAQALRRKTTKEMWITNGVDNRLVVADSNIPSGWTNGRTIQTTPPSQKGKFWINNGTLNKMSTIILVGWQKGKLTKKETK